MQYFLDGRLLRCYNERNYPHVYTHVVTRAGQPVIWCKSEADAQARAAELRRTERRRYDELLYVYLNMDRRNAVNRWTPPETIRPTNGEPMAPKRRHRVSEAKAQAVYREFETDAALAAEIRRLAHRKDAIGIRALEIRR